VLIGRQTVRVEVNQRLGGRYELQQPLGSGGMAVVWRAHDEVLGRSVAIKVLAGAHIDDPASRRRIRDEARSAATLSHPNIAQVYDFGESTENGTVTPYVVMELIPGHTLAHHMNDGTVPTDAALRICAEVAAALAAAHADGLVHRDIKPANVMVTPTGAKVVDFGIAAAVRPDGPPDPAGEELFGTPAYLAPERLTGRAIEPASDVYALGVLLYRLLAGHSPWTAETTTQMLSAHVYVEPTPLPQLPGLPEYVVALCNRCLEKDPTQRPSARDVAAVLAKAAGAAVVVAAPVAAANPPAVPPAASVVAPRRGRRRVLLAAAVAAVAGATAALWWSLAPDGRADQGPSADGGAAVVVAPSVSGSARPTTSAPLRPVVSAAPGAPVTTTKPGTAPGEPGAPGEPDAPGAPGVTGGPAVPTVTAGGQGPTTKPVPTSVPTTVDPPDEPEPGTFESAGGTIVAVCTSPNTAQLTSWTAKSPYTVGKIKSGPARIVQASFVDGRDKVKMQVSCRAGEPSVRTTG
jgi:serine/threonine-protein kinase